MSAPNKSKEKPITLGERLATALVSAIAAALTVVAYFVINLALASKAPSGPPGWVFDAFASKLSVGVIVLAAIVGFVVGSSRMAEVFAVLWGTSERCNADCYRRLATGVVVVVVVAFAYTRFHGR